MMSGGLAGKVVLVTGGGSGIGRAAALAFGRREARVVVASRRVPEGEETAREVRQAGSEAIFVATDVTRASEVEALVDRVAATWGRIDCAFNNAGITGEMARTADCTEENWDRTISVNLTGVWYAMKHEIRQMLKQGGGAIVNNASAAGLVGMRGGPAYSASKGGVIQLTRTAALEYAKSGIRVNAVCPGFIETPMTGAHTAANPDLEPWIRKIQPMGRLGTAEEVGEAVVWLCSDASSFVTGHALSIDGGMAAQ
ncbi:MAG TPA: SDR family oxidoreductase [Terriglobia bacterium]|nr:SDR family oxidoreductase [Terriglobia bacterium]